VTQNAAFKRAVRERMAQTGQTYSQALRALLAEQSAQVAFAETSSASPALTAAWGGEVTGRVTMGNSPRSERAFTAALDAFGQPAELLAAKCAEDLVLRSGLQPAQFALRDGRVELPNCLLVNDRSEWLIVQGPNCGYLGHGPRKTVELLERFGAHACATDETVVGSRYLRVALGADAVVDRSTNPLTHITFEQADVVTGVMIVSLSPPRHPMDPEWLEPGKQTPFRQYLMSREGGGNTVKDWCDEILCSSDPPDWVSGPPRVRCYRTYEAAAGLAAREHWQNFRPTLVLEQGNLQLWCDAGVPGPNELLSRQASRVLELVGLHVPQESRMQRLLRRAAPRSAYIDVDEDGAGLSHEPVNLAELREVKRIHAASFPHPAEAAVRRPNS